MGEVDANKFPLESDNSEIRGENYFTPPRDFSLTELSAISETD